MDDGVRIAEDVEVFLRAARGGDVAQCAALLKGKPELLNTVEAGGYCALHFAAFNGDAAMLEMLIAHKPALDLENFDGNTPLVMAIKGKKVEAIRTLAAAGANVNHTAKSGSTPLHHAAAAGALECFRVLVELGASLSSAPVEGGSPLHWACHSGNLNTVGAMIYEFAIPVDTPDQHGGTPLMTALFMKQTEVVEFLLDHGANPNIVIPGDGTTPLHIAMEHANVECVRALVASGANPTVKNAEGATPADLAAKLPGAVKELSKPLLSAEKRTEEAVRFKTQGNKVFGQGENVKAAKFYTLAIHLDNANYVYFSNRAACYFNQGYFDGAYWDACRCIALNAQWPKGYLRKSATELAMKRFTEAFHTAMHGLKLDPNNKDLALVKEEALKQGKSSQ